MKQISPDLELARGDLMDMEGLLCEALEAFISFSGHALYFPTQNAPDAPQLLGRERRLLLPLPWRGKLLGVLMLHNVRVRETRSLLGHLPALVHLCLENLAHIRAARTDALTGLATEDVLYARIQDEAAQVRAHLENPAQSDNRPAPLHRLCMGLVLLRLENGPLMAREMGYGFAEKFLHLLANACAAHLPSDVLAARVGRYELALLLSASGRTACQKLARSVLDRMEAVSLCAPLIRTTVHPVLSAGHALYPQDMQGPELCSPMFEQARLLMARASVAATVAARGQSGTAGGKSRIMAFARILQDGGVVLESLPLGRVRISLGRQAKASEGLRFAVWSHHGKAARYKGEIVLLHVREDDAIAEIVHLEDAASSPEAGDSLALLDQLPVLSPPDAESALEYLAELPDLPVAGAASPSAATVLPAQSTEAAGPADRPHEELDAEQAGRAEKGSAHEPDRAADSAADSAAEIGPDSGPDNSLSQSHTEGSVPDVADPVREMARGQGPQAQDFQEQGLQQAGLQKQELQEGLQQEGRQEQGAEGGAGARQAAGPAAKGRAARQKGLSRKAGKGQDGSPAVLHGHGDFLHRFAVEREQCGRFVLVIVRLANSSLRDVPQEERQLVQALALWRDALQRCGSSGGRRQAFCGRYGSNGLIFFHPDAEAEALLPAYAAYCTALEKVGFHAAAGLAGYPFLQFRKAEMQDCALKALEYALLLPEPRAGLCNSLALNISADRRYSLGDVFGAVDEYKLALLADKENVMAWNSLGVCMAALGRQHEARRHFLEALKHHPDAAREAQICYNLGTVCQTLDERRAAARYYRRCIKSDAEHLFAHIRLGQLCEQAGRRSEARRFYEQAASIEDAHPGAPSVARRHLARVAARQKRGGEARELLHEALVKNPDDAAAMLLLAKIYLNGNEDPGMAELLARKSAGLHDRPEAWKVLSRALHALGREEEARVAEARALLG